MTTPRAKRSSILSRRAFASGLLASVGGLACGRAAQPLIFAASSLGPVLGRLLERFGRPASIELAGSQVLRSQIELGARPDLFFSAHPTALTVLEGAGLIAERGQWATTHLVLASRKELALGRLEAQKLCEPQLRWVLASSDAPLGQYTDAFLRAYDLEACMAERIVSRDPSASASLGRLRSGDADIAISFESLVSEPKTREGLVVQTLPSEGREPPRYLWAQLRDAKYPVFAREFIEFLQRDELADLYAEFGMRPE